MPKQRKPDLDVAVEAINAMTPEQVRVAAARGNKLAQKILRKQDRAASAARKSGKS